MPTGGHDVLVESESAPGLGSTLDNEHRRIGRDPFDDNGNVSLDRIRRRYRMEGDRGVVGGKRFEYSTARRTEIRSERAAMTAVIAESHGGTHHEPSINRR